MTENFVRVCAHCCHEIEVKRWADEALDYCESCELIEGETEEITVEEYERRHQ